MTDAAMDLTPPTKKNGKAKEVKEPKAPKAKKEAVEKDPNAPKKPRGPRQNYGYHPDAVITVQAPETAYRGARLDWYNFIGQFNGLTVKAFEEAAKDRKDPPRGWLRFFVQDGSVTLSGAPVAAAEETAGQTVS